MCQNFKMSNYWFYRRFLFHSTKIIQKKPAKVRPVKFAQVNNFIVQSLTSEYLPNALDLLKTVYVSEEILCQGAALNTHPEAIKDLEDLAVDVSKDGVSLVAIHKENGEFSGFSFNKIVECSDLNFFANSAYKCKHDSSKLILNFLAEVEKSSKQLNMFTCVLKPIFVCVSPNARNNKIGTTFFEVAADLVIKLQNRDLFRVPINEQPLQDYNLAPQVLSAIMTNNCSKKIGKNLNFKRLSTICYTNFKVQDGIRFTSNMKDDKDIQVTLDVTSPK